jgi:hypothetical protein
MSNASTPKQVSFYALPGCRHLTHTWGGYIELALQGLAEDLTASQVQKITLNGMEQKWRAMGDQTLMIIPSFKQEAQQVTVHLKPSETPAEPRQLSHAQYSEFSPDLSMGLSKAHNRYLRNH